MARAVGVASAALERAIGAFSSLLPGFFPAAPHGEGDADADVEELGQLGRTMRRIRAALDDGSPPRHARASSAVARLRLRELRALAYDAEDVVGECEYEAARRGAEAALEPTALAVAARLKRVRREVRGGFLGTSAVPPCTSFYSMKCQHEPSELYFAVLRITTEAIYYT